MSSFPISSSTVNSSGLSFIAVGIATSAGSAVAAGIASGPASVTLSQNGLSGYGNFLAGFAAATPGNGSSFGLSVSLSSSGFSIGDASGNHVTFLAPTHF